MHLRDSQKLPMTHLQTGNHSNAAPEHSMNCFWTR
jgi:hypothetical protein